MSAICGKQTLSESGQPGDAELVRLTRAGSHEAYKELVTRYQGHVYGLAYSVLGDWAEAQDAAQEAFLRAYTNLDQLRDPDRFAAWLRRVAFGVTMDWLKSFRPKVFQQLDGRVDLENLEIPDFQPAPPEAAERRELAEAVLAAVASLPPKYRLPLTMFHLDGLSYRKVADFLDIPLGTAKSLISRAQAKLKAALAPAAKETIPMVQEVFNEHKLPAEFASKVLQNVAEVSYRKTECTFCGAVCAYLDHQGAPVPYEHVMGVSGSAFKTVWHRAWCPSNNTLLVLGLDPVRRAFHALGYSFEFQAKARSTEAEFRRRIVESIRQGRPVLCEGIIGPPEVGIVTGFDQNGDILLGRSFFHESREYYRKSDWYKDCHSLLLIGARTQAPSPREVLRDALTGAVDLARTPQRDWPGPQRVLGLAAYDAWAAALLRDEDFPAGDRQILTFKCTVNKGVTLCGLIDSRRAAGRFLRGMAGPERRVEAELHAAADQYDAEVGILTEAAEPIPLCTDPPEARLRMADRGVRENLARSILLAKARDEAAIAEIEKAVKVIGGQRE